MIRLTMVAATVAILAAGCAHEDVRGSRFQAVDSGGTRIATNMGVAGIAVWHLERVPSVVIGREGVEELQFYRIVNVLVLSNRDIVVANGGSMELRHFNPRGEFIESRGGKGSGPGEYQAITSVSLLPGDSIQVVDARNRRVSILDPMGEFIRAEPMMSSDAVPEAAGGLCVQPTMLGRLSSGRTYQFGWACVGAADRDGLAWYEAPLLRWDPGDHAAREIGVAKVLDVIDLGPGREGFDRYVFPAFQAQSSSYASGDRFFLASPDRFEIRRFAGDSLDLIVRVDSLAHPVTSDDRERFLRQHNPAKERKVPSEVHFPETMPPFDRLRADPSNRIWARKYSMNKDAGEEWFVFDSTGRLIATMGAPRGLRIESVSDVEVLGVVQDTLDVEQVAVFRIARPE